MQVNAVDDARARAQAGESLQLLAPSARLRAPTDQLFDGWLGQDERESWINIESDGQPPHTYVGLPARIEMPPNSSGEKRPAPMSPAGQLTESPVAAPTQ
jgi:hypothetical protein